MPFHSSVDIASQIVQGWPGDMWGLLGTPILRRWAQNGPIEVAETRQVAHEG